MQKKCCMVNLRIFSHPGLVPYWLRLRVESFRSHTDRTTSRKKMGNLSWASGWFYTSSVSDIKTMFMLSIPKDGKHVRKSFRSMVGMQLLPIVS